ncbi:MAG: FKBP-type peptidyl-prolyl cis-trans isomerase [Chitinophagales bacterium]
MRPQILIFFYVLMNSALACGNTAWKTTASGISYIVYTKDSTKPKPLYGDHLWMQLRKIAPSKKEVFNTRIFDAEEGVEMDFRQSAKKADVTEVFAYMGIGDSAQVKIPASLIDSNGSAKKKYTFWLNLLNFKPKEIYLKEKDEQNKNQYAKDSIAMAEYRIQHHLDGAIKDEYGNWYIKLEAGSGKQIEENDSVTIHYIGKLLNGQEFDNSYFRNQTFTFVVGKKQVIEGLDKGIRNFQKGDHVTLFIPSALGYGDKSVGKIPANSVLIFEMEIMQ